LCGGEGLVRGDGDFCDYRDGLALVAVPGEEGGVTLKRRVGWGLLKISPTISKHNIYRELIQIERG